MDLAIPHLGTSAGGWGLVQHPAGMLASRAAENQSACAPLPVFLLRGHSKALLC